MKKGIFWAVFLWLLITGCSSTEHYVKVDNPENTAILQRWMSISPPETVHIRARAEYYGHGISRKGYLEAFVKGRKARLELWGPTDILLEYIVVKGSRLVDVVPPKKKCLVGVGVNFMGLDLSNRMNYSRFFSGLGINLKEVRVFRGNSSWLLKGKKGRMTCSMVLRKSDMAVLSYGCKGKRGQWKIRQSDFEKKKGIKVPKKIILTTVRGMLILKIRVFEVDKPLDNSAFDMKCPEDFKIESL